MSDDINYKLPNFSSSPGSISHEIILFLRDKSRPELPAGLSVLPSITRSELTSVSFAFVWFCRILLTIVSSNFFNLDVVFEHVMFLHVQLLRIEEELGAEAVYAGAKFRVPVEPY